MHDFLKAWSEFEVTNGAKVLPGDEILLEPRNFARYTVLHDSWHSVIRQDDFGARNKRLHLSLIPQPFFGSVATAPVVILTLNPGLHGDGYYSEFCVPEIRKALIDTLRQRPDERFPHIWLNPQFSWHSGFSYWHGRLSGLIDQFTREVKITRLEALSFFAKSVATLELLPYHSESFGLPNSILGDLRSVKLARAFATEFLMPRVRSGEALLIAARQGGRWDLPVHPKVVVYRGTQTRAAYLTPKSPGGAAILEHLRRCWRPAT